MKSSLLLILASGILLFGCQKQDAALSTGGNSVKVSFEVADLTEETSDIESKVFLDASGSLKWDGSETASVIVGKLNTTTSKSAGLQREISQVSKGAFEGTVDLGTFADTDVQAVVIPHAAGAYFAYKNSENRIIMPVPSSQIQQKNGVFNPEYYPLFAQVTLQQLQEKASVALKPAASLVRFNVYGSHPAQAATEILRTITMTASGGSNNTISGTCEWKIGNTSFSSNGSSSVTAALMEKVTIADKTKDDGVKLFASVILGGTRTITKIVVDTDRAKYTKTLSKSLSAQKPDAKAAIYPINIDLSDGTWTRSPESDAPMRYIDDPYTPDMLYSSGHLTTTSAVMQSFDIDPFTGEMFYSQLNNQFRAYMARTTRNNTSAPPKMTIKYFGHVSNFSLEVDPSGDRYIWVDNFSTKNSSGEYWGSTVISRIKHTVDAQLNSWEAEENYYFGPRVSSGISGAVDVEGDMMTVLWITTGDIKTYSLSQLRALPIEDITLEPVTYGGESASGIKQTTKAHTIKARDCSKVKPLGEFNIPRGTYPDGTKVSWQGFDIKGGLIYQLQGNGYADGRPSPAMLQVRGIDGSTVVPLTYIAATEDLELLKEEGFTDTGYMEAEGVKVHGDYVYIGFAAKNSSNVRLPHIFRYSKDVIRKK